MHTCTQARAHTRSAYAQAHAHTRHTSDRKHAGQAANCRKIAVKNLQTAPEGKRLLSLAWAALLGPRDKISAQEAVADVERQPPSTNNMFIKHFSTRSREGECRRG